MKTILRMAAVLLMLFALHPMAQAQHVQASKTENEVILSIANAGPNESSRAALHAFTAHHPNVRVVFRDDISVVSDHMIEAMLTHDQTIDIYAWTYPAACGCLRKRST